MNPAYQAPEIEYSINKVGMSAIVFCDNFKTQNYYELLSRICPEIRRCEPGKLQSKATPSLKAAIFISENDFK